MDRLVKYVLKHSVGRGYKNPWRPEPFPLGKMYDNSPKPPPATHYRALDLEDLVCLMTAVRVTAFASTALAFASSLLLPGGELEHLKGRSWDFIKFTA